MISSIAAVTRTLIVWITSILVTATAKEGSTYKWENLRAGAIVLELVGFIILVFGNLVYSDIITVKALMTQNEYQNAMKS